MKSMAVTYVHDIEPSGSHQLRESTRSRTGSRTLKLPSNIWVNISRTIDYCGEQRAYKLLQQT